MSECVSEESILLAICVWSFALCKGSYLSLTRGGVPTETTESKECKMQPKLKAEPCLHIQGEKDITDAKDAEEASKATAAATQDTEGVVAKEAAAVKAEANEAAEDAPAEAGRNGGAEMKKEVAGAAAVRAASEQDASTSGRETVPGQHLHCDFTGVDSPGAVVCQPVTSLVLLLLARHWLATNFTVL